MTGAMPPAIALRKEAAAFPESLLDLRTEESVRAVLEDFNRRVKVDRLRPAVGNLPPLLARTVDVDDLVAQWRDLRAERAQSAATAGAPPGHSSSTIRCRPTRPWVLDSKAAGTVVRTSNPRSCQSRTAAVLVSTTALNWTAE